MNRVLTRKVVLPVVLGVWAVALLVGIYTVAVLPSFNDYYDLYVGQPGFGHATVATAFRRGYPLGAVLALAILIAGVVLAATRKCRDASDLVCDGITCHGGWLVRLDAPCRAEHLCSVASGLRACFENGNRKT